jgi:hypothetical protein
MRGSGAVTALRKVSSNARDWEGGQEFEIASRPPATSSRSGSTSPAERSRSRAMYRVPVCSRVTPPEIPSASVMIP